jgi:quercetin dioxygenase-like cupin family protein
MPQPSIWRGRAEGKDVEMVPGVRRHVLACGDKLMVVKVTMAKDSVVPMHTHPHEQTGYIAGGTFRFTIGDETRDLQEGDGYTIAGGIPHGGTALVDNTIAVDTFSPPREDYHE